MLLCCLLDGLLTDAWVSTLKRDVNHSVNLNSTLDGSCTHRVHGEPVVMHVAATHRILKADVYARQLDLGPSSHTSHRRRRADDE